MATSDMKLPAMKSKFAEMKLKLSEAKLRHEYIRNESLRSEIESVRMWKHHEKTAGFSKRKPLPTVLLHEDWVSAT